MADAPRLKKGSGAISGTQVMKYEEFKSTPVLYEAYKKTRRGKRSKKAEAIFESSETENLKRIARQIDKGYLPAGLDSFMIYEPKARLSSLRRSATRSYSAT